MLKRYQVLLTDWLEEYLKAAAEKYDLSFSEALRALLCNGIICGVASIFPEYKLELVLKELESYYKKISLNSNKVSTKEMDMHTLLSKLYFEARKAVEFSLAQEKKKNKNNKK